MSAQTYRSLARVLGTILLLTLAAFPLRAHQVDPTGASSPALTATGTVAELIVDNQVTKVTLRYLALRLDDGQTVALTGPGLDSLSSGARVAATGNLTGNLLMATSLSILPTAGLASNASAQAQRPKEVQGTLVVFHKDYFAEGRSEYGVGVHDGAAQMTPLNLAVIPDALRPGMTVNVAGTLAADGLSLNASQITILGLPPAQANGVAGAPVTNNVLVMPIKFTDSPASDPFTPSQVDQVMRTNASSVAAYYNEVSYGQQQLNITVACATAPVAASCGSHTSLGGWLLASSATPASCDFTTIGNLADQAATAAGYNLANYNNRFYVMPNLSCGWAGLAYVGYPYQAWSNAYNVLWVYGHELGHNFSLWHAGSLNCNSQVIGGGCSVNEYGDRFDIMGNNANTNEQMHFNAAQKSLLNWIPASSVVTHSGGSATYTLSPLESAGQATYAVKIPVATDANRTYWIEYRQPIGFDSGIASYPNNGAQIRVASPFDYPCTGCGGDDTELLDMTPGSAGGFYDGALLAGQTYTDSANGISVTVNSATSSALTLTVSMGGTSTTTTTLASSAISSVVGASVTFTATVTGRAPTGSVTFTADGTTLTGCAAVALPSGSASSKTVTCSTASLAAGTHSIVATYAGDATNNGSASTALSQVVNSTPPAALVNPSFEIPALGSGYQYSPSVSGIGWTFASGSGIQGNNSAWGAAAAPDGTQTAFIQGIGSIAQTLNLSAGSYTLSFQAAQRPCCVSPYVQPIKVTVDGTQIGSLVSPASTSFSTFSISFSVSSTGAHTITFTGTDPSDKTTFIDQVTLTNSTPPAGLVNPGFEIPALGSGYQYSPSGSGIGWTFASGGGIQGNNSTWSAAAAPDGTQTAFIQGIGSIAQTLTLSAGSYTLSFQAAQRPCCVSPYVQPIKVTVDGTQIGSLVSPASTSFSTFSISFSVSSTAAHTITFTGTDPSDKTTFIDQVTLTNSTPPAALVNPGFELPALGSAYQYGPSGAGIGWTFAASSGIQGNGSAWLAATAPDGTQTAFIQGISSFSQTVSLTAGSYTLSFQAAQRSCCVSPYVQPVKISVDGTQIGGMVSPASTSFSSFSIPFSVSSTAAHTITFTGTDPSDKTIFIDEVTLQ